MTAHYYPLQVLLFALSGWVNRVQQRGLAMGHYGPESVEHGVG